MTKPSIARRPFHCSAKNEKPNFESLIWVKKSEETVTDYCAFRPVCFFCSSLTDFCDSKMHLSWCFSLRGCFKWFPGTSALAAQAISALPSLRPHIFCLAERQRGICLGVLNRFSMTGPLSLLNLFMRFIYCRRWYLFFGNDQLWIHLQSTQSC